MKIQMFAGPVALHSSTALAEALRKLYGADALADALMAER